MPERDRLASSLLEVTPLRSPIGIAALRDLVALYLKDTEVEVRPGLEPEKCNCLTVAGEQKPTRPGSGSTKTAYSWKHIYDCYKTNQIAEHGFAELCFHCQNWIVDKLEWEDHCQAIWTAGKPFLYNVNLFSMVAFSRELDTVVSA